MSMITEQVERLRTLADIAKDIADNSTDTVKTLREAADTIEQLEAKVRAENNESQPCEDAISRQAAIDAVAFGITYATGINMETGEVSHPFAESNQELRKAIHRICELPPVNPQEPKTDSWSIKDVADTFKKHGLTREQEPKTGHWIKGDYWSDGCGMGENYGYYYECSDCGGTVQDDYLKCSYNYCPNCGCRMVELQESENK